MGGFTVSWIRQLKPLSVGFEKLKLDSKSRSLQPFNNKIYMSQLPTTKIQGNLSSTEQIAARQTNHKVHIFIAIFKYDFYKSQEPLSHQPYLFIYVTHLGYFSFIVICNYHNGGIFQLVSVDIKSTSCGAFTLLPPALKCSIFTDANRLSAQESASDTNTLVLVQGGSRIRIDFCKEGG